ncbi:MAG: hypothetical protein MZU84_03690 [Sphingobacterium sp.]|nr:hypothetical protein [Sphingobacterium sp.]
MKLANGVVNSQRDAGNAEIVVADGININAGIVNFELKNGQGKTYSESGNIQINGTIIADKVNLISDGINSNVVLGENSSITALSANNSIVISSSQGNFINNAGNSPFSTPNGRWLVYSSHPDNTLEGISSYNKIYNRTYALNSS